MLNTPETMMLFGVALVLSSLLDFSVSNLDIDYFGQNILQDFNNDEECKNDKLYLERFKPELDVIESDVQKIIDYVMSEQNRGKTWNALAEFVDKFGPRFSGTQNLENAIAYMTDLLKKEGHDNVHGEPVTLPVWTRGHEHAKIVKPLHKRMKILGLGYSVGTDGEHVRAPVLVVKTFEELYRKSSEAKGKIVVFNAKFDTYDETVEYRSSGASHAAQYGAVAAMIRSVTPFSIGSPHTGMQTYWSNVTKIPAISITVEDAELLQRISDRNEEIEIEFVSRNKLHEETVESHNTVSELVGSENPEQVVIVSGHLDSWDVGQGAMDDGGGAFVSWRALSVLKQLGLKPKRTLRSILWTGEEMDYLGAIAYRKAHLDELNNFVLAMESDIGTFTPRGVTFNGKNLTAICAMNRILQMMTPLNATRLRLVTDGSDITVFDQDGVLLSSLDQANEKYFWFHHTEGDMMTVEDPVDLEKCTALWTAVSYAVSALTYPLPR